MSEPVALVLVSHSRLIAEGTKEMAQAMAPDVHIGATGGNPDGGLGSSFDVVEAVIRQALLDSPERGVVILTDLGSSTMTVDAVIDMAESPMKVRHAPGPLVEGAVAAAVAASQGEDLDAVVDAVSKAARTLWEEAGGSEETEAEGPADSAQGIAEIEVTVGDRCGLHARTAAILARRAAGHPVEVRVNGALATSVVDVLSQGINYGDLVTVRVEGEGADQVAKEIAEGIARGFDETAR